MSPTPNGLSALRPVHAHSTRQRSRFLVTAAIATAALLCVGASAVASPQLRTIAAPMVASSTSSSTAWAIVVMGKNDGHHDLFPELFNTTSTSRWQLATPPGVADNGGLFLGTGTQTSALAGIGTSQALAFSPLAYTASSGRNWVPGGLEFGLARVPSAIALGPGQSAAVLVTKSGRIVGLRRTGSLEQWSQLVTTGTLSSVKSSCGVNALNAVAITSSSQYLVGTTCARPHSVGVFADVRGRWTASSAQIPPALSHASFETIRLTNNAVGVDGMFVARTTSTTELVAGWLANKSSTWTLSSGISLAANSQVLSTGEGPGAQQFALIRTGSNVVALISNGGPHAWQRLGGLPADTQSLAFEPNGTLDALVVHASALTIWRDVTSAGSGFAKVQTITVPIQYGSSG